MSKTKPKNIAASIRQKLLNKARQGKRPFNELLQYYAMERFLYRLSTSKYSNKFILKGGLLFRIWDTDEFRPTMDIDMLGKVDNREDEIADIVKEIISLPVEADGMSFDNGSMITEKITEDADYEGIRVKFKGILDTAKVNIQLDIGFGDTVFPNPIKSELPTNTQQFTIPKALLLLKRKLHRRKAGNHGKARRHQ